MQFSFVLCIDQLYYIVYNVFNVFFPKYALLCGFVPSLSGVTSDIWYVFVQYYLVYTLSQIQYNSMIS